jgi:Tol biopolymer transport system component
MRARRLLVLTATALGAAGGALASPAPRTANPAWSPDGTRIAFASFTPARGTLTVVKADGTGGRGLYSGRFSCCGPIAWASPDRIVFVDNYRLQAIDVARRSTTLLSGDSTEFVVSPDGTMVAFIEGCECGHAPDSLGVAAVGGGRRHLVPKPEHATDSLPVFSPDGRWLVFTRGGFDGGLTRTGSRPALLAVPVAGGTPRPIVRAPLPGVAALPRGAVAPAWSPDGRWLAFSDRHGLQIVATRGGRPRTLVRDGYGPYSWSPRSSSLAFVTGGASGTDFRLATVDLSGRRRLLWRTQLRYTSSNGDEPPRWSPDGSSLVFMGLPARPGQATGIYAVGADGRGLHRIA